MRVGFTGTREGMTVEQAEAALDELIRLEPIKLAHGMCVGADAEMHDCAKTAGLDGCVIHGHPPVNNTLLADCVVDVLHKPRPYLDRDRDIVDGTEWLIAAPKRMVEEHKGGTWYTVRYARGLERPITICWPDGSVTYERLLAPSALTWLRPA